MPAKKRLGWDNTQRLPPVKAAREPDERNPSRMAGARWCDLALLIQGQLPAQEEVLRGEGRRSTPTEEQATHAISQECQQRAHVPHAVLEQGWGACHDQRTLLRYGRSSLLMIAAGRDDVQSHEEGISVAYRSVGKPIDMLSRFR
jgi:hypothetical protein